MTRPGMIGTSDYLNLLAEEATSTSLQKMLEAGPISLVLARQWAELTPCRSWVNGYSKYMPI